VGNPKRTLLPDQLNHKNFAVFVVSTKVQKFFGVSCQEVRKNVVNLDNFCWKFLWLADSS